jgi:hypothetical protein
MGPTLLLPDEQERQRRQSVGVRQLGHPLGRAAPIHRLGDVEDDGGAHVRLFLELLHHPLVGARDDLPVDVSQVVARLVRAELGEFD